jgi:hypothetical protein
MGITLDQVKLLLPYKYEPFGKDGLAIPTGSGRILLKKPGEFEVEVTGSHPVTTTNLLDAGGKLVRNKKHARVFLFPFDAFEAIAGIVKAKKRWVPTPEQRERLRALGRSRQGKSRKSAK